MTSLSDIFEKLRGTNEEIQEANQQIQEISATNPLQLLNDVTNT